MLRPGLLLDPNPGEGGTPPELPKEIEIGGVKYNPAELLEAHKEYGAHKEDLKNLESLKQDAAAYADLGSVLQANPAKLEELKVALGRKMAGLSPWDNPAAPPARPATPPPPEVSGKKPELPPVNPEILERLQAQEENIAGLRRADDERKFQSDLSAFQTKYPAFKDEKVMKDLYQAGRDLTFAKAREYSSLGYAPQDALVAAQAFVGNMSHEQIMLNTPMRKHFEDQLLKAAGTRPGLPGGIGTPAERVGGGQPGPTPELDEQLRKEIAAAGLDADKRRVAIEKWATQTGRNPLELYGLDPVLARQLAPS